MTAIIHATPMVVGHPSVAVRDWMSHATVARFVWNEVDHVDWEKPNHEGRPGRVMTSRGRIILAVLTYAYSRGIYRSEAIEEELMKSTAARQFFANVPLNAQSLRYFRRHNRDLVEACLARVLLRALKAAGNRPARIGCDRARLALPSVITDTLCAPLADAESSRRVYDAVCQDRFDSET